MNVSYNYIPACTTNPSDLLMQDGSSFRLLSMGAPIRFAKSAAPAFTCQNRELARIDAYGNVSFADDLTMDELKFVVVEMAKLWKR